MTQRDPDPLRSLIQEWGQTPLACEFTADRVCAQISHDGAANGSGAWPWFRIAAACVVLGLILGAAYGEWHTIPHEDLTDSPMATLYLRTIDPSLSAPAGSKA